MRRVIEDAVNVRPSTSAKGGGAKGLGARGESRNKDAARTPPPRTRVVTAWQRRVMRASYSLLALGLVVGGASLLWHGGTVQRAGDQIHAWYIRTTAEAGFRLADVRVLGRAHTRPEQILSKLPIQRGDPLLALDVAQTKKMLETLPWVRSASVERRLPDMLRLSLDERQAVALWQREGHFVLLDAQGTEINDDVGPYRDLPILVGEDAPRHVSEFWALLKYEPEIGARVKAAVLVSGRRWNLQLDHVSVGVEIRLPEENPAAALKRLVALDHEHGLLKRKLVMIDLRLPDRLVVQVQGDNEPNGKTKILPSLVSAPGRDA
ncbi:MAG: FtsQ-type POTRA domain-containing protein [Alphaproteobacteria bacterium]|nr:FtsQ-type POTRA domain-containing protein [Alphaproteobacteria bacterium]